MVLEPNNNLGWSAMSRLGLTQNKLSFVKTTLMGGQEIKDTADNDFNNSTSKEGQRRGRYTD